MKEKLNFAAGVMNIVLAASLTVNTFITMLCVAACVIMPLLLPIWFLPFIIFIPLFGAIFLFSLSALVCNMVAGVGTVVASIRGGKISHMFAAVTLAVDVVFLPFNTIFFAYGVFALNVAYAVNWLTVLIALASGLAVVLTIVSIVLNAICLSRNKSDT